MQLWRPVGLKEMELIFDSEMKGFPPRLPGQPIFYPVLNRAYAEQIAGGWNTKEEDRAGYVTRFELPDDFSNRYARQVVGSSIHEEWWVPAQELSELNQSIMGGISVEAAFFALDFKGLICLQGGLKGKDAKQQFQALAHHLSYSGFDVWLEMCLNRKAVFLHYSFWKGLDPHEVGVTHDEKNALLRLVEERWSQAELKFPLPKMVENQA